MSVDPATQRTTMLLKDARIGDLAFNRADRSLWGIRHLNGICTLVRIAGAVHAMGARRLVAVRHGRLRSRRLARRVAACRRRSARSAASRRSASSRPPARWPATRRRSRGSISATSVPNEFVFSPDGRYLYGSSYYTGASNIFRYDLAGEEARRGHQRRDRLLPADSARRRRADRLPLLGRGLRADAHRGAAARGRQPDHLPRRAARRGASDRQEMDGRIAGGDAVRRSRRQSREYRLCRRACASNRSIRCVQGYKTTARRRATGVNFSDPLQLNRASRHGVVLAGGAASRTASALHLDAEYQRYDWRAERPLERRRFLRSVRADEDEPQRLRRRGRPQEHAALRRAAAPRARRRRHASPAVSTSCPIPERAGRRSIGWLDSRRSWPTPTSASRSATWTTRAGSGGRRCCDGEHVERRRRCRRSTGPTTTASRCRSRHSSIWSRSAAGLLAARPRAAVRELLLRRLRQQLGRSPRREALS